MAMMASTGKMMERIRSNICMENPVWRESRDSMRQEWELRSEQPFLGEGDGFGGAAQHDDVAAFEHGLGRDLDAAAAAPYRGDFRAELVQRQRRQRLADRMRIAGQ